MSKSTSVAAFVGSLAVAALGLGCSWVPKRTSLAAAARAVVVAQKRVEGARKTTLMRERMSGWAVPVERRRARTFVFR